MYAMALLCLLSALLTLACGSEKPESASQVAQPGEPTTPVAFVDSGQDLGKGSGNAIALGDADGDGDCDAIVSTSDAASSLWMNDGKGKFTLGGQAFAPSTGVALGDLDGDGDLDAFFTVRTVNHAWLNDGKGGFVQQAQDLPSPDSVTVTLGDLDGDGDLDAFVVNWSNEPDQVFLNDGKGTFTDSKQKLGTFSGTMVALGDVDADGDLDAMVSNNGEEDGNSTVLYINDGKGKFADSRQRLGPSNAYAAVLGDLDGDGDLDAFIANSSHNGATPADTVWLNDGKGVFADSGQSLGSIYSLCAVLADFDGDGDLDAFTGSWKSAPRVWMNDGKAGFTNSNLRLASPNASSASANDLNGDGAPDIFVATNTWPGGDGLVRLWFNQPPSKK